jgi:uncharacterized protein YndB with AHSA1/START domain
MPQHADGLEVTVERTVPCAPEEVWRFVVDGYFEHHHRWDPAVTEMTKLTAGPLAVGTRGREVRSFGGKQAAEFEVTELEAPRRFAFRNTSGPFELERSYDFEERGGTTQLVFRFRMRPKGVMRLLFPLVRRKIGGQVEANIDRIPGLVRRGTRCA